MNQLWVTLRPHLPFMLDGFLLTVFACTLAIIGAVLIGALMAPLRTSGNRIVRGVAFAYSDVFRNTPFIVQLFSSSTACRKSASISARSRPG